MIKSAVRSGLHRFGYSVTRERSPDLMSYLTARRVDLVLDIGANVGQFARALRRNGYQGRIESFEPIREVAERARVLAHDDLHWTVTRSAVGSAAGEADINVSELTVFSSFKVTTSAAAAFDDRSRAQRTERVPVTTVAEILRDYRGTSAFLKVDTQGFEREVLDGARDVLHKVAGIQLELPITQFYKDTWTFSQAIAHCETLGFIPAQFRSVHQGIEYGASAVEFDCVFRPIREG